jgi:hypothetical protein
MDEFTGPWQELEDQLAELNELATQELEQGHPAPDGLPPKGSWIRAITVDDDGHPKRHTPWHYVVGWDGQIGCLSVRCRRRTSGMLAYAIRAHRGEPNSRWDRPPSGTRLLMAPGAPAEACRQCELGLRRDAEKAARAELQRDAEARLARLESIATLLADTAIPEAELGGLIRQLWSGGAA